MLKKLLISVLLFVTFTSNVSALSLARDEEIELFRSQYTINTDGTVNVVEQVDYYFPDQRHGIFRVIPLSNENQDGEKLLMSASAISITDEKGNAYIFQDNSTNSQLSLKIGDPNKAITGSNTYIISYTLSGAVTYFTDHDEFYWNVTGNEWEVPIRKVQAITIFPGALENQLKTVCYTGAYGSEQQDCVTKDGGGTNKVIETTKVLSPKEGFSFSLSFPKGLVQVIEPVQDNSDFVDSLTSVVLFVLSLGWYLFLPGFLIFKAIRKRRKTPEEKKVVAAWFDPPKTSSGRELTAGEVGVLHDRKGDVRDITATLIQLAQKGYFKISSKEKGFIVKKPSFTLIKKKDWLNSDIQPYEKDLLDDIFDGKQSVELSELGKRVGFTAKLEKAYKAISKQLVVEGLYEEDPHKVRQKWNGIMVVGIFFFNPLFIIATVLMASAAKRTSLGGAAWATVESLKNFVKSQERQLEFQAKNQIFFEKLLPYATALGVEKIWAERFKDLKLAQPDWLESDNFNTLLYVNLMSSFNSSVSSAVSMSTTRSSSGFSSGFSGGFSGGGGGGGGGGSW